MLLDCFFLPSRPSLRSCCDNFETRHVLLSSSLPMLVRAQGCYKGFSSMILKEGLGNTVYFGSYELCKQVRV